MVEVEVEVGKSLNKKCAESSTLRIAGLFRISLSVFIMQ